MNISHNDALALENIVKSVYQCKRFGMGGYIEALHFEFEPFDAALIAISPLWQKGNDEEIEAFLSKWDSEIRQNKNNNFDVNSYVNELRNLVNSLKDK